MKGPDVIRYRYTMYVLRYLRNTHDLHNIYRVIQNKASIFLEVIVSVTVG